MPQAISTRIEIDPKALGWKPIGHINLFRPDHIIDVWPAIVKWIKYGIISDELKGDQWESSGAQRQEFVDIEFLAKM